jgi:hypothetical protein
MDYSRNIRVRIGTYAHERVHIFVPEHKGPSTSFTHGRSTGQPQHFNNVERAVGLGVKQLHHFRGNSANIVLHKVFVF